MAEDMDLDVAEVPQESYTLEELAVKFPGYQVLSRLAFDRHLTVELTQEQSERIQRIDQLGTGTPPMTH